jgi:hypothetical protein
VFAVQAITFLVLAMTFRNSTYISLGVICGFGTGLIFIPWLPTILTDLKIASFWIQTPKPHFILDYFYSYFGKDIITTAVFIFFAFLFFKKFRTESSNAFSRGTYIVIACWLGLSYFIPYLRSIIGVPMLHIRYTIVSLPAWLLVFSVGWDYIKNVKIKFALLVFVMVVSVVNLFVFRKYYSRLTKQQFRECAMIVKEKDSDHSLIFTAYPWHWSYYFKNAAVQPSAIDGNEMSRLDKFWLLQVQMFSSSNLDNEIKEFPTFHVAAFYDFRGTRAVLLVKDSK